MIRLIIEPLIRLALVIAGILLMYWEGQHGIFGVWFVVAMSLIVVAVLSNWRHRLG